MERCRSWLGTTTFHEQNTCRELIIIFHKERQFHDQLLQMSNKNNMAVVSHSKQVQEEVAPWLVPEYV